MSDKRFFQIIFLVFAVFMLWLFFQNRPTFKSDISENTSTIVADTKLEDSIPLTAIVFDTLFSFKLHYDSVQYGTGKWYDTISSIDIIRVKDRVKIQTVIPPTCFKSESEIFPSFVVEDMNFDGFLDFRVLDFVPMYGCETYHYWLYNSDKKRFEKNEALEVTSNVKFDEQSKTIKSHQRGGGPFDQRNEIFTWENGKLALQYSEEVFMGIKNMEGTFTMKKRIDGKLIERSKQYDSIPFTANGDLDFNWDMLK